MRESRRLELLAILSGPNGSDEIKHKKQKDNIYTNNKGLYVVSTPKTPFSSPFHGTQADIERVEEKFPAFFH